MMKIIQSFWTGDRDALHSSYGWLTPMDHYLGSAELISSHRQRVADVTPHSDEVDKKPP